MYDHTAPFVPASPSPKLHRIRHCDVCGAHLRGPDRRHGRCPDCRVGDVVAQAEAVVATYITVEPSGHCRICGSGLALSERDAGVCASGCTPWAPRGYRKCAGCNLMFQGGASSLRICWSCTPPAMRPQRKGRAA